MRRWIAILSALVALAACTLFHREPPVFVVFFTSASTDLSPDSRQIVDQAARAVRASHPSAVIVAAGVLTGDNLKLAEPRFFAIRQLLIADGVDASLIARAAIPDAKKDVGGVGNQRVEIRLVQKAP